MAQDFAKKFYGSAAWLKCRKAYIQSVFCRCEICEEPIGMGGILHHKILLTAANIHDPEITLNWKHLIYVCQRCHNDIHLGALPFREDVRFDDAGRLVQRGKGETQV